MHGQFDLIYLAPNDLLPRLTAWGEASDHQFGQEGFGLCLWVNNIEASLLGRQG